MDYTQTLQDIRRQCRMAMNGDVSAGMRKYGLAYKLNFGLVIGQIRDIAARYEADAELAALLWKQETRELKILAAMLYPPQLFTEADASSWALEIPNQEIREQVTINLFQNLSFASGLALRWAGDGSLSLRATGYWLLGRLLLARKLEAFDRLEALPFVWVDVLGEDVAARNAALMVLKQIGRRSEKTASEILTRVKTSEHADAELRLAVYDNLLFELSAFHAFLE